MRGGYWLSFAGILLIIGLLLHQVTLVLISLLLFIIKAVTKLWERYCLTRVEYCRTLSSRRAFFGDEIELEIEIANRKPLPLPWLEIIDEVPTEVTFLKGKTTPSEKLTQQNLNNLLSLGWYHKVIRHYPLQCLQRGCFTFGPARIRSGDLFGFARKEMETKPIDYLTVYPKIVSIEKPGIPSNQPLGNIRTRRHLFQDPILSLGVRDYHFGDSLKQIHWKTTARVGKLQTKVFEPTTTVDMGIFLDVRTIKPPAWGNIPELFELVIIVAASLAHHALAEGCPVGLYVNQPKKYSGEAIRIPPSQHQNQLLNILEALARLHASFESMPIARFVPYESQNLPWGSSLVVISAAPTDELINTLFTLRRAGRQVTLMVVGGQELPTSLNGLNVYHVPDNVPWQQLEVLKIQGITQ